MLLFNPSSIVPKSQKRLYLVLRTVMLAIFLFIAYSATRAFLLPSQYFSYSFGTQTAKNTLSDPIIADGTLLGKSGRLPQDTSLRIYAGTFGNFTSINVNLALDRNSIAPETIDLSVRKSFRAFFFPDGSPIETAPKDRVFSAEGSLYLWDGKKTFPFLSEAAALSRFDQTDITPASDDLLRIFPPENDLASFRIGSLLSNDEGVFVVMDKETIRPIGSPEIFTSLGFDWNNVIPADGEELRYYQRGKVLSFDAEQPDGTLFRDRDTGAVSLIDGRERHRMENGNYTAFLSKKTTPIEASSRALETDATCVLKKHFFTLFGATYSCTVPIAVLDAFPGESYELMIRSQDDLHIASMNATFVIDPANDNLPIIMRQLGQLRDQLRSRYQKP